MKPLLKNPCFWIGVLWVSYYCPAIILQKLGILIFEVKPGLEPLYGYPGLLIAFVPGVLFLFLSRSYGENEQLRLLFRKWLLSQAVIMILLSTLSLKDLGQFIAIAIVGSCATAYRLVSLYRARDTNPSVVKPLLVFDILSICSLALGDIGAVVNCAYIYTAVAVLWQRNPPSEKATSLLVTGLFRGIQPSRRKIVPGDSVRD